MNNKQLKEALFSGCPVEHNGIVYKCISGIIYRSKDGELNITAEVTDKNNNSISIVEPRELKFAELSRKDCLILIPN
ncbi:MAG: hypothetical protein ACI4RP_01240 [Acutalibacteraceae bacterium]